MALKEVRLTMASIKWADSPARSRLITTGQGWAILVGAAEVFTDLSTTQEIKGSRLSIPTMETIRASTPITWRHRQRSHKAMT